MKKRFIPLFAVAGVISLVACTGGTSAAFDLTKALEDKELGYCILVGEDGNPEALDRTAGSIAALKEMATEYGFTAKELERKTCIDSNGNSWNDQIAKETVEQWTTKYKGKLDFIISNNDGMAIAASNAKGLAKGTPIVGFDALSAACDMIKDDKLAGSVSQNGDDQALAVVRSLTSMVLGSDKIIDENYGGRAELNLADLDKHIIQTKFAAVTKQNADSLKPGSYVNVTKNEALDGKKMLVAYYSANDNFIKETFQAALPHYAKAMGWAVQTVAGDGSDDAGLLNQIKSMITAGAYDAYAFNIITHANWEKYVAEIGGKPVVFFKRQPKNSNNEGVADLSSKEKIYFVGSGSTGQGIAQGQIIKDWFKANHK